MFRAAWRLIAGNPILIAQAMASASGAYVALAGATWLNPDQFVEFALLTLSVQVCSGAVLAFLYQSSLVTMRHDRTAHVRWHFVAVAAALSAVVFALCAHLVADFTWSWTLILALASTAPVWSEWLRHRAMSLDRRGALVAADGARFLLTLATPVVLAKTEAVEPYFAVVCLAWFAPYVVLVFALPRIERFAPRREYLGTAGNILVDFLVGQMMAAVPLLVLGGFGQSQYLGGVRLAQTILGPVNLLMSAFMASLAADGVNRHGDSDADLIAEGRRLAFRVGLLAAVLVPAAVISVWVTGYGMKGVVSHALLVGLILVGLLLATHGFSNIHSVVLHLLGRNGLVAISRVALAVVTTVAFVVGYLVGGVDGSLVAGFVVAAIANPVVFVLPAYLIYRRILSAPQPAAVADQ